MNNHKKLVVLGLLQQVSCVRSATTSMQRDVAEVSTKAQKTKEKQKQKMGEG